MNECVVYQINSNSISVMAGFFDENKSAITFSYSKEYSNLFAENGSFLNKKFVIDELKSLNEMVHKNVNINDQDSITIGTIHFNSLHIILGNYEFPTINSGRTYTSSDLKRVRKELVNKLTDPTISILDVELFNAKDDMGNDFDVYKNFGARVNKISCNFLYYTVTNDELAVYKDVFNQAGLTNTVFIPAKVAVSNYLKNSRNISSNFVLIQTLYTRTEFGLVVNGHMIDSTFEKFGLIDLYQEFISKFNLKLEDIKHLAFDYGIDVRNYEFPVNVFKGQNRDGVEVTISQKELNEIIRNFGNSFSLKLNQKTRSLLQSNNLPDTKFLYMICGSIADVPGFVDGFTKDKTIKFYSSKNCAAQRQNHLDLLAAFENAKYYRDMSVIDKDESANSMNTGVRREA